MSQAVNIGNTMKAVQPTATAARADGCRFIAADVGGTNARIALVHADADGRVEILDYRRYPCATYPGLTAILAEFAAAHAGMECNALARMTIACAGVVLDEEVINSNLPWRIRLRELRDALGLRELHVINDFTAAAHGVQRLTASESRLLTPGVDGIDPGPLLVVGPGTGLGAALCIAHAGGTVVVPTEAGMTAFAPGNAREIEILRWMQQRGRHVPTEQLLSGLNYTAQFGGFGNLLRGKKFAAADGFGLIDHGVQRPQLGAQQPAAKQGADKSDQDQPHQTGNTAVPQFGQQELWIAQYLDPCGLLPTTHEQGIGPFGLQVDHANEPDGYLLNSTATV